MNITKLLITGLVALMTGMTDLHASSPKENRNNMENLTLTKEWDKTFPKSDKVDHSKVMFVNRYGITLAATLASTMYDMSRVTANGYFDADDNAEARNALREQLATQRTEDYINGTPKLGGGVPDVLPDDAPKFLRDYHDYYKTKRGYHPRSLNSNGGRNATSPIPWINFPLMSRAGEIENAVMILHGEKAHSFYFGSDAYKKLTVAPGKENNKLFMVIPGASHTDLYDQKDIIPFAEIEKFFNEYLGKK